MLQIYVINCTAIDLCSLLYLWCNLTEPLKSSLHAPPTPLQMTNVNWWKILRKLCKYLKCHLSIVLSVKCNGLLLLSELKNLGMITACKRLRKCINAKNKNAGKYITIEP